MKKAKLKAKLKKTKNRLEKTETKLEGLRVEVERLRKAPVEARRPRAKAPATAEDNGAEQVPEKAAAADGTR